MSDSIAVLHVDDDPSFTELVATFLERRDKFHTVETERRASDGLERLSEADVDCVVSDLDMPGSSGIEFLEAVREEHDDLPFILFTGKGSEEVAADAISAGVTDYLQKGTDADTYLVLANRIENAVTQYRAEQRAADQARRLTILRDVNQALVDATARAEIETRVCEIFAAAEPYRLAWLGDLDAEEGRLVPRAGGGIPDEALTAVGLPDGEGGECPASRAIRSRSIVVERGRSEPLEAWDGPDLEDAYESLAAVPLVYHGREYGVLAVFATQATAFGETERDMLDELAGDIGQAIHAAETRRRLDLHRTAVENVPEGVFILDEEATIELVNEPVAALLERAPEALEGVSFPTFVTEGVFDEEVIEWYVESIRELLSSESGLEAARYETTVRPAGGDSRTVEIHLSLRPFEDEFRGTVGLVRDVTDRKEREQTLQESEERYRRLVETAPVPIILYDAEGVISYANDAAVEFAAAESAEDVVGRSAVSFVHPEDRDLGADRVRQVLDEREPSEPTELTFVDLEGTEKQAIATGVPDRLQSEPAAQVVLKEVTALKRREAELQQERDRLDEFVSVVSHDLRNPLTVAQGHHELAREDCDSEHLETIGDAHDRMEQLLEDLLALAREGAEVSRLDAVRLRAVVDRCWQFVGTDDARLAIETDQEILADESRLQQLLENLFKNAVEHGGEDVVVTVGDLDDGFYLADDGPGISADERDQVFEVGYTTAEAGTGFGLGIVDEIAGAHGWEIAVSESDDGGARFEITGVEVAAR